MVWFGVFGSKSARFESAILTLFSLMPLTVTWIRTPASPPLRAGLTETRVIESPVAAEAEEAMSGRPATARAVTAVVARPRLMPLLFMKIEPF